MMGLPYGLNGIQIDFNSVIEFFVLNLKNPNQIDPSHSSKN